MISNKWAGVGASITSPPFLAAILLLGGLGLRLYLALSHPGHLGVDGGAYLLSRNAVLGDEPTGVGFPRPPLAPGWLLVPFTGLFGDDVGYKLFSVFGSLAPAIPFFLLARRFLSGYWPVLALAFFLVDLMHGEMIVTGVLPLIGFGLLTIALLAISHLVDRWSRVWATALVLTIGLIPYVNHTTAGITVIVLPVYFLALVVFYRHNFWHICHRVLPLAIIGAVIGMGALPWYMDVLPITGELSYPGPLVYLDGWGTFAWWQFAMALPLGYWMARYGEGHLRALGVVTIVLGVFCVLLSTDESVINIFYRSRYLLAIPLWIGIIWVIHRYWWPKSNLPSPSTLLSIPTKLAFITVTVAVLAFTYGYIWQFHGQARYSDMATPDVLAALERIPQRHPGVIANGYTLAHWVAALNKTPTSFTFTWTPPPNYQDMNEGVSCILGWRDRCDVAHWSAALPAQYVLLDTRFPYYNERAPAIYGAPVDDPWAPARAAPWLHLLFSQGTVLLYQVIPTHGPGVTVQ